MAAMMKRWKLSLGFVFVLSATGIIFFGYYYCQGTFCALKRTSMQAFQSNYEAYLAGRFLQHKFSINELDKDYDLNLEAEDVIVFLHIQKTGGTVFGKHLVENLEVHPPCNCYKRVKKHCDCLTKNKQIWLFSRFTTGWDCGLHADWTELKTCVDNWFRTKHGRRKRKYYYITVLRDPVARFLSEWMHVRRGATWKSAALKCNGREATLEEVPFCYTDTTWTGVTLQDFINCKHNLAFNRQTRMLANLSKVNCYITTGMPPAERARIMLQSAKENLMGMAFFGLVQFQTYTQFLFEHTLNMNFLYNFEQRNSTHISSYDASPEDLKRITELNYLDIELYQFAKDLFLQRVRQAYIDDDLPVPEEVTQLITKTAVEAPTEWKAEDKEVLRPVRQDSSSRGDSQENDASVTKSQKDIQAERLAKHIFLENQLDKGGSQNNYQGQNSGHRSYGVVRDSRKQTENGRKHPH